MPAIFEHSLEVASDDIDAQGHAGNVSYVRWMQDAALAHSSAQGWPPDRYRESGAGWVVRHHEIEYLQPAWEGDHIVVVTWVADFKKLTSLRRYRIIRRDPPKSASSDSVETLLAQAATNWVHIGFERRLPRRIPNELRDAFIVVDDAESPGS